MPHNRGADLKWTCNCECATSLWAVMREIMTTSAKNTGRMDFLSTADLFIESVLLVLLAFCLDPSDVMIQTPCLSVCIPIINKAIVIQYKKYIYVLCIYLFISTVFSGISHLTKSSDYHPVRQAYLSGNCLTLQGFYS